MPELVPWVESVPEVFRESSTELRTTLGLSRVGAVWGTSKEPINMEILASVGFLEQWFSN